MRVLQSKVLCDSWPLEFFRTLLEKCQDFDCRFCDTETKHLGEKKNLYKTGELSTDVPLILSYIDFVTDDTTSVRFFDRVPIF